MKNLRGLTFLLLLVSAGAMADILKAPKCSSLPDGPNVLCGEVTDFCGPHFGACTGGSNCNGTLQVGAIYSDDDHCINLTIADKNIKKGLQSEMGQTKTVCVQGTTNSD